MSTLQNTPQRASRISSRPRGKVLALSTLAAIALALLILVPTTRHATAPTVGSIAHDDTLTARTPALVGCFRDPANHAVHCSHAAPSPVANPASAGYFRDPATHKLMRLPTARHRAGQHLANHSRGRIIP